MTRIHLSLSLFLSLMLVACGGSSASSGTTAERADDEEDADEYIGEGPADEDDEEEEESGFVDDTLLRTASITLGEPTEVPGTGVTMRVPEGAQRMPMSAGFIAMRERVQISVAVLEGDPGLLESIRTGGMQNAPEPTEVDEVEISGVTGRLGRDQVRTQQGVLERQWLLVHDGTRGLGIVATYEGSRARGYRRPLHEALENVQWDNEGALDPSEALGIAVGPAEGLQVSNRTTANLVMLEPDGAYPPQPGQPVLTVSPLPMRIPEDRAMGLCPQLAARFMAAPEEEVQDEQDIEGELRGCERVITTDLPTGERVMAYAAVLFHQGVPILVTGFAGADAIDTWRPRFNSAARTVRIR